MFSKACEYGIRAIVFIAVQSLNEKRVSLKEIAQQIDSPEAFTAKILQQLSKKKLITSIKGPYGGYQIPIDKIKSITLMDIVVTLDGDDLFTSCGLGLKGCNAQKPCPLHDKFLSIRNELTKMLNETSLYKLSHDVDGGLSFLNR